jgi:hypothetical protein
MDETLVRDWNELFVGCWDRLDLRMRETISRLEEVRTIITDKDARKYLYANSILNGEFAYLPRKTHEMYYAGDDDYNMAKKRVGFFIRYITSLQDALRLLL